ncbi:MAG TPA: sugar transferase [Bacteroidales bacterium]|nr:sugar transferase [Bacteroidales bacterium]
MTRLFDIIFSFIILIILLPLFLLFALVIILTSKGGVFYLQKRVGKDGKIFSLIKFRTMFVNADKQGLLTVGNDKRITKFGKFLRKYKLDELPQFLNVLIGQMSIVGPRPEVPKYVDLYNQEQKKVLSVKPGITDYASLLYFNESNELVRSSEPEKHYINVIMPHKINLSLEYIENKSLWFDIKIIFWTFLRIVGIKYKIK